MLDLLYYRWQVTGGDVFHNLVRLMVNSDVPERSHSLIQLVLAYAEAGNLGIMFPIACRQFPLVSLV